MSNFSGYCYGLKKMQEFIINDLRNSTIKGHANFLVAMALFNYIEILGSFYFPCDEKDKEAKRFNFVFTNLLPDEYNQVFIKIRDTIAKPYNILRCGMTHGYIPNTFISKNQNINISYDIIGIQNLEEYNKCVNDKSCAIELIKKSNNEYLISIYNPRFIHDFESAFNTLKNKINSDDDYKAKFVLRSSDIYLNRLK